MLRTGIMAALDNVPIERRKMQALLWPRAQKFGSKV